MKKSVLIFTLIIITLFTVSCSNSDDEVKEPYTAYTFMPSSIIGTWKYKVGGAENIDAVLKFEQNNNEPYINIKINQYTYSGKPYYPTSGGDGAIYFKLEGKTSYSKISYKYNPNLPNIILFKIENVESYTIEKEFQKAL